MISVYFCYSDSKIPLGCTEVCLFSLLFFIKNIHCRYLLELPCQGDSNRPVYIQNMACVVTNEDMCSFGYLSVVHHRMRQTSSIALNERLKQSKNFMHNLIYIISA